MLRRSLRFRGNVLRLLHNGTTGSPQNVDRSVDIPIVVGTTFRARPLPIRERKSFVVKTTSRTRFRCRCPLTHLTEFTLMFETLVCQNLNKTPEGKIRDFATPETFHTRKVQRLGRDTVKSSAEGCSKFEMPISALVGDMPIKSCELTDSTPPIARPVHFTRKTFAEFSELIQGVFQELWRLYFLTGAECQVSVHTEIYPYALTCSKIEFDCGVVCNNIEPIGANRVTKDLDIANISFPIAGVMKRKPAFIELQRLRSLVPFFERKANTTIFKFVSRLKLRRTITVFAFELRQSTKFIKKAFDGIVPSRCGQDGVSCPKIDENIFIRNPLSSVSNGFQIRFRDV